MFFDTRETSQICQACVVNRHEYTHGGGAVSTHTGTGRGRGTEIGTGRKKVWTHTKGKSLDTQEGEHSQ